MRLQGEASFEDGQGIPNEEAEGAAELRLRQLEHKLS